MAPLELKRAIEAIARGETYLSPRVSKALLSGLVLFAVRHNLISLDRPEE